jgi:hypothetical protein
MTNGKSLTKTNQRTIFALIAFLVWILSFHSTSCNEFVFRVQSSQRSSKMPSKTIQLTNNGPANTTSSFLQFPNDCPAHFEQLCVPTTTASTGQEVDNDCHSTLNDITTSTTTSSIGQQADNDHHYTLNDITTPTTKASTGLPADNDCHSNLNDFTSPQAFFALTATSTATMTQVPAITTAITKATIKLDKCFLHPVKTGATMQQIKVKVFCFMLFLAQHLRLQEFTHQVSCCFTIMTIQQS